MPSYFLSFPFYRLRHNIPESAYSITQKRINNIQQQIIMEQLPLLRRLSSFGSRHTNPMSPIPHAKSLITSRKVWLDDLPLELCTRVASFIINFSYRSVVNYASVSETQRAAMKNAFAGKLDLRYVENATTASYEYSWDSGEAPTWLETDCVSLIGDDIEEVHLSGSQFFPQNVQDSFKSPAITKLSIHHRPCSFQYLLSMSNLRVLDMRDIRFEGLAPFLKRMSIPILDLQELRLHSCMNTCLHKHFSDHKRNQSLLASWFPRVEKLSLACGKCQGIMKPPSYLWFAMEKFSELKEVTITEAVPDYAVDRLRQMDCVSLQDGDLFKLAEKLTDRVISICTTDAWCESPTKTEQQGNQFERIAGCSRLEYLTCCTSRGTEHSLAKVTRNLRSLRLRYAGDESTEDKLSKSGYLSLIGPRAEALLTALKVGTHLKSVSMGLMPIPANKLCEMLVVLGEHLEEFWGTIFSLYWKEKRLVYDAEENKQELEGLILLLRTAALHNPSLRTLRFESNLLRLGLGELVEENVAQQSIFPLLPTFQASVAVLLRHAPRLDGESWKRLLRQFRASCSQKVSFSEESD